MNQKNSHYRLDLARSIPISKTVRTRMSNIVNVAKAMLKNGCTSNGRTFHICAAVVHGKIIEIGINNFNRTMIYSRRLKQQVKYYEHDPNYKMCLHAEVCCLLKLVNKKTDYDFSKIDFYNIRINKLGHCCNSAPCNNCTRMFKIFGYKHVYFFDDDMTVKTL